MMCCSGNRTGYNIFIAIPGDRRELFRSETVSETTDKSISRRYIVYAATYTLYIISVAEARKLFQPLGGGLKLNNG